MALDCKFETQSQNSFNGDNILKDTDNSGLSCEHQEDQSEDAKSQFVGSVKNKLIPGSAIKSLPKKKNPSKSKVLASAKTKKKVERHA